MPPISAVPFPQALSMRSLLLVLTAGMLATACAGGSAGPGPASAPTPATAATVMKQAAQAEPPKPKAFDPSGMYTVSLTYGGMPLVLTLQLGKQADGSFSGAIVVDQVPQPIPLNTVAVTGKRVVATLSSPDGSEVTMDFTIEGNDLTGTYRASSGDGSAIAGKKIP